MDLAEFGKRVKLVREEILEMNQAELAEKMKTNQVLLSRLENGIGGSINLVFDFINFLNKKKLPGHLIFREPFDLEALSLGVIEASNKEKLIQMLKDLKENASSNYDKLVISLEMLSQKTTKK